MQKSCLLDRVRDALRVRHHSICTEESYLQWIKRFVLFHNKRHGDGRSKDLDISHPPCHR